MARSLYSRLLLPVVQTVTALAKKLPANPLLHGYTIDIKGTPYITRTLFPRLFGWRVMLHYIHRPDTDIHCHTHPWMKCISLIIHGGYTESRIADNETMQEVTRNYDVGDFNVLRFEDAHRIELVEKDTWTLFFAGPRSGGSWGFLVKPADGPSAVVHHAVYEKVYGGRPVPPDKNA